MNSLSFQIPPIPKRPDLIAKFSTFLVIEDLGDKYVLKWQQDLHLKNFLEQQIKAIINNKKTSIDQENLIINYCLNKFKTLTKQNLGESWIKLLKAYLQESCYWSVKEIFWGNSVNSEIWYNAINKATLILQTESEDFINKYDQHHSSEAQLNTFVKATLKVSLQNELKLISKWRLLFGKNTNQKNLKYSLEKLGISESEIKIYLYVWSYFKEVYVTNKINIPNRKKGLKWPKPDTSDFEETVKYCNENKNQPHVAWEISRFETITSKQVEDWMSICIKALREFNPKLVSYNSCHEKLDYFRNQINQNNISQFAEILLSQQNSLKFINTCIEDLTKKSEQITFLVKNNSFTLKLAAILKYGLNLKQTFIAKSMGCNQSTISRHLKQNYQQPLESFINEKLSSKDKIYYNCFLLILNNSQYSDDSNQLNEVIKSFIQDSEIKSFFNLFENKITSLCLAQIFWGEYSSSYTKNTNFDIIKGKIENYKDKIYQIIKLWFNQQIQKIVIYLLENHFYYNNINPVLNQYSTLFLDRKYSLFSNQEKVIKDIDYLENSLIDWFKKDQNIVLDSERKKIKSVIQKFLTSKS